MLKGKVAVVTGLTSGIGLGEVEISASRKFLCGPAGASIKGAETPVDRRLDRALTPACEA